MTEKIAIHWFRQDLRLGDNPALTNATQHQQVLPIYILDDINAGDNAMGGASRWWLHNSLHSLAQSLGDQLSVYQGNPIEIFKDIIARIETGAVYWNRCYEPWRIDRDAKIEGFLQSSGIAVQISSGSLLWEPESISKDDGTPYRIFTPFYKNGCLKAQPPRKPLTAPVGVKYISDDHGRSKIDALKLLPTKRWDTKFEPHWSISEESAQKCLQKFMDHGLKEYAEGRDHPAQPYVSRLSPYLHFGHISPNQLWYGVRSKRNNENAKKFSSELCWREFSYSQLFFNPELPRKNLREKFDDFPWIKDDNRLLAWQQGQTGVPMVDAGMRELWQTGYMHNRVRMIVGSFLVKNLLIHWHHGERWFWDTLVDADLANNCGNWQWVAGCGVDAAPYFRIFNPVSQGKKFDPGGHYIRQYVPEIAKLPNKYLFSPWSAPADILKGAGIKLGETYPTPIVDLKKSRDAALAAFHSLKPVI